MKTLQQIKEIMVTENNIGMYSTYNGRDYVVLKMLLEPLITKFTNIWLKYQKIGILIN